MVDIAEREVGFQSKLAEMEKTLRDRMSPPDALGLPPLLEKKRWKHGIPDEAFTTMHATFDRIFVVQVEEIEGETYGEESRIIRADTTRSRQKNEAPRGVIVSAGLLALDEMRSNGIDVGHTVVFMRNYPFRIIYTAIAGVDMHLVVLRAGDIAGSMDLAESLKQSNVSIDVVRDEEGFHHEYKDEQGRTWNPAEPYVLDEM